MNTAIIPTALIGFGTGGRYFHAPLLEAVKGFELRYILTRSEANREHAQKYFPQAVLVADLETILADAQIRFVVIATPNHTHFPLAKSVLEAGKNVVLDKPFTVQADEAEELTRLASEKNLLLTVFHNRRWDGDFLYLKEKIQSGALGKLKRFHSNFHRYRKTLRENSWKEQTLPGSGLLFDLGSHLIDQSLLLFGLPERLHAFLDTQRPGSQATDFFELQLFYAHGLLVTLSAGMLQRPSFHRFEAVGTEATLAISGFDHQENLTRSGVFPKDEKIFRTALEKQTAHLWQDGDEGFAESSFQIPAGDYRLFYGQLSAAFSHQNEVPVKPIQAMQVIKLIGYALESHRTGKVVDVKI